MLLPGTSHTVTLSGQVFHREKLQLEHYLCYSVDESV